MTLPEGYKSYCPTNAETIFISPTAKRVLNDRGHLVWRGYISLIKPIKIEELKVYFAKRGYIKIKGIPAVTKPKQKMKMKDLLL